MVNSSPVPPLVPTRCSHNKPAVQSFTELTISREMRYCKKKRSQAKSWIHSEMAWRWSFSALISGLACIFWFGLEADLAEVEMEAHLKLVSSFFIYSANSESFPQTLSCKVRISWGGSLAPRGGCLLHTTQLSVVPSGCWVWGEGVGKR